MHQKWFGTYRVWSFALLAVATTVIGCQNSTPSQPTGKPAESGTGTSESGAGTGESDLSSLTGNVVIDGSSTVFPISEAAAVAFKKDFPNINVTVGLSGTGGGFKVFSTGDADISDASRPIKKDEIARCVENKIEFVELPVAYDGLTVVVNPGNDWAKQLTIEQLQRIFTETKTAKSWKEIDPSWPDSEIKVYSPGTDSGTFDYFKEVMGKDNPMRTDMSTSEDDNVLVTGVAGDKGAIGFFGVAYFEENKDKLRAVPIVNPKTEKAMLPEVAAIESGEYAPLSRPLFIYVNVASLKRPECRKFVEFYIKNAKDLSNKVKYVGLPDELYARAQTHLDDRLTGTHYLTESGESREGSLAEIYTEANLPTGK